MPMPLKRGSMIALQQVLAVTRSPISLFNAVEAVPF
jgi:hypothetical protein